VKRNEHFQINDEKYLQLPLTVNAHLCSDAYNYMRSDLEDDDVKIDIHTICPSNYFGQTSTGAEISYYFCINFSFASGYVY